jgi:predicted nuclease of predicted toxin-antitoxin system
MKLLLDENLSRRTLPFLLAHYPESSQVALLGLEGSTDRELWAYARANDFVLVSHDADFYEISLHLGQPPKLIWLRLGNSDKATVIRTLTEHREAIQQALFAEGKACIEIA